jgi:hypothetical protein
LERLRKTTKYPTNAGVSVEIRTEGVRNTSLERYLYANSEQYSPVFIV